MASSDTETEVKLWLKNAVKAVKLNDFSVKIVGNSEKGDGYFGDIIFVTVYTKDDDSSPKEYDFVLKCGKRNKVLRETSPMEDAFLNEIFIYDTILPEFTQFQKRRGVDKGFDSIAKCFGTFVADDTEIIVVENLKKKGYELWPKKTPLTRKHIEMVVKEYGKFHATSFAMEKLLPEKFQKFVTNLKNIFEQFTQKSNMEVLFGKPVEQSYELLQNDLDESILLKWKNFKNQIDYICGDMQKNIAGIKVILHGDCWNNNFMYLHDKEENIPLKVAFLDWQISRYSSPIFDLSYFLFSCISETDMQNLDKILVIYHNSFIRQLKNLGVNNTDELYPFKQFMREWKEYCKFGIMLAQLLVRMCATDSDEVVDMAQTAESGKDYSENFVTEIKDTDTYRKRIRPIVKYAVKHDLI